MTAEVTGSVAPYRTFYFINSSTHLNEYTQPVVFSAVPVDSLVGETLRMVPEGKTKITYWSQDSNEPTPGVESSRVRTIYIDRTAPIVVSNAATLTAAKNPASTILKLTATDQLSGVATGGLTAKLDDGPSIAATSASGLAFKDMSLGSHVVAYSAPDVAGNVATGQVGFVLRDTPAIQPAASSFSASRKHGIATFKLGGTIRSFGATPLVGASVVLEQKASSGVWKRYGAAVTSDSHGRVTKTVTTKKAGTTQWRWRAATTLTERQAVSATMSLKTR